MEKAGRTVLITRLHNKQNGASRDTGAVSFDATAIIAIPVASITDRENQSIKLVDHTQLCAIKRKRLRTVRN